MKGNLLSVVRWFRSIVEDKAHPNTLSSTRVVGLLWALTAVVVALILGVTSHLLVAEFIGGSLAALGVRNLGNGRNRKD